MRWHPALVSPFFWANSNFFLCQDVCSTIVLSLTSAVIVEPYSRCWHVSRGAYVASHALVI